jgi:hypothetical protein
MNDLVEMILLYIAKYALFFCRKLSEKNKSDQRLTLTFHTGRRSRCSAVA